MLIERALPRTVALSIAQEPDLPSISVDQSLLSNALLNLALNANDAMPAGGRLSLRAFRLPGEEENRPVCIEVAVSGEGIDPEILGKVFDPFFTTKPPGKGDGLRALEALQVHGDEIGVVLLDLLLPGVSGERVYEMLQIFRPEVPVLVATGRPDQAQEWIPGIPCLTRPFTDRDLLTAL